MRFVEETGGLWTAEQLRAAEAEIEQQKREWEANRLEALQKEEEAERKRLEEDELLTYSRADAKNQVNNSKSKFNKQSKLLTQHANNNRANRKRGATDRDLTPSPLPNTHKQGRVGKPNAVARKRVTSRSTVSNHSGSERRRQKSLVKRSPSVAPAVPKAKRQKIMAEEPPKSIMKRVPKVVRNSKARAALLTKQRREAAAQRQMMLHKKTLLTNASGRAMENDDQDSNSSVIESTDTKALINDDENSECSLDAMYDSNDDDHQSEEAPSKNDNSNDEEYESEEERRPKKPSKVNGKDKKNSKLSSSSSSSSDSDESVPKSNHFDINSPRSTRSRGTVKLNLWTLDVSPIMPAKRRSKTNQSNADQSEDPPTSPVPSNTVSKKSNANATTTEAEDSCASVGSLKQAKIRDGFNNGKATTLRKKATAKKNLSNPSSPSTPTGRNNTLDNWISKSPRTLRALSPMVILNKDDISRHMLPSPLAATGDRPPPQNDVDHSVDDVDQAEHLPDEEEKPTMRRTRAKSTYHSAENGQVG